MTMDSHRSHSPSTKDVKSGRSRRGTATLPPDKCKPSEFRRRAFQNIRSGTAALHRHTHAARTAGTVSRPKRARKACERCRMKKIKCDGECPCTRCAVDGIICTPSARKKVDYKKLTNSYGHVLESTQVALVATIQKLYFMARNSKPWELGEPDLNDRGEPIIHNIAEKLGCIGFHTETDNSLPSVFPEDEASMTELARQLESREAANNSESHIENERSSNDSTESPSKYNPTECESSPELNHSDIEQDRLQRGLSLQNSPQQSFCVASSMLTFSAQNCTDNPLTDFEFGPITAVDMNRSIATASTSSLHSASLQAWPLLSPSKSQEERQPKKLAMAFLQQAGLQSMYMFNQELEETEYDMVKSETLFCSNSDILMDTDDAIDYLGFQDNSI